MPQPTPTTTGRGGRVDAGSEEKSEYPREKVDTALHACGAVLIRSELMQAYHSVLQNGLPEQDVTRTVRDRIEFVRSRPHAYRAHRHAYG